MLWQAIDFVEAPRYFWIEAFDTKAACEDSLQVHRHKQILAAQEFNPKLKVDPILWCLPAGLHPRDLEHRPRRP